MVQYEVIAYSAPCQGSALENQRSSLFPPPLFTQHSHATTFHITLMKALRLHVWLRDNVACMSADVRSVTASLHHICPDGRQKIKK